MYICMYIYVYIYVFIRGQFYYDKYAFTYV